MATSNTASQGFTIRITGVTGQSFNARTKQNVQKRIEKIIYIETPPADAVKLAYVGSSEISPTNNLFIGDRSDSLYANSRTGTIQEFIGSQAQQVNINKQKFLVTQKFNTADSGNIPLYYKFIFDSPTTLIAESVKVFDKNFEPVTIDKYQLSLIYEYDDTTGLPTTTASEYHLYNNLESYYDPDTGEYEIYFVQYTELISGSEVTTTKLLDNELAYQPATSEDYWYMTGELKPWSFAYVIDGSTLYLPVSADYAVKYQEENRISVKPPIALSDTEPWFLRVVNGSFTSGYDIYSHKYSIPEFSNQAFNPIEPYKIAVRVECDKINKRLIKLPHNNIQSGSLFSSLYIVVELDGEVQYAVTNDSLYDGNEYRNLDNQRVYDADGDAVYWSTSNLLGIDSFSGIVNINFDILDTYKVYATYPYTEEYFELTSLNMNPIFDQDAHGELRSIYMIPESSANRNLGIQTESIKWVKVSSAGVITSTNQDSIGGNEQLNINVVLDTSDGYKINGAIGLHYNWRASTTTTSLQEIYSDGILSVTSTVGFPRNGWIRFPDQYRGYMRYAKYVGLTDTSFLLSGPTEVPSVAYGGLYIDSGTTIELVNFVDERTTLSNRTADDEKLYVPSEDFVPVSFSRYFVLAEVCINPPHSVEDLVSIDLREDGGGIDINKYDEAKAKQPQAQWFNDYGDFRGQPYPGNAVIVVKLSALELENFSEQDIERIVNENMPLGIKPLVRYYGYEPYVVSILPGE